MGASILPVSIHNNQIYFLFGKEQSTDDTPGWSDFGGGSEKNESLLETAIREGSEELTGFLGNVQQIKTLMNKYGTFKVDYVNTYNGIQHTYRVHIFPIEYDDKLPYYYNNNHSFLQNKLDKTFMKKTKIFEKQELKWFCINDLQKNKKLFRSFYQNIIDLILLKCIVQ